MWHLPWQTRQKIPCTLYQKTHGEKLYMDNRTSDIIRLLPCPKCGQITKQELVKRITTSGAEFYGRWCPVCKWWANPGTWISKELLIQHGLDLANIRTAILDSSQRCSKCGLRGAELHHWAPKELFGANEAENWPKDYLCVSCHQTWHKTINKKRLIADKR